MNIKVLKSWTLRVAVFGLLINEPLLSPSVAIPQDTHVSSPITTLQDNQSLPSDFLEIFQDKTVLSLITTLREIDNTERHSPYKDCSYDSDSSMFDDNCELKRVRSLPSPDNIPAIAYLADNELVRLEETLKKLIELETKSVYSLKRLLQDDSQLLRESAIYALSEISSSSRLVRLGVEQPLLGRSAKLARLGIEQSLLEVLANDESPAVRDHAAFALARIKPRTEVIDALIKTFVDNRKPTGVRRYAGSILNEISLDNISLESVKFLVKEHHNLVSDFRHCYDFSNYFKGIISEPNVTYILIQENIYSHWETFECHYPPQTANWLYKQIRKFWF